MLFWTGTIAWGLLILALWWREFRPASLFAIGMIFSLRLTRELGIIETDQVVTINSFTPLIGLAAVLDARLWRHFHVGKSI